MQQHECPQQGQVVIPEEIRKALKLTEGKQFVVLGEKDVIILKIITPPSMKNFDHLIAQARKQARRSKIKKSDNSKNNKKSAKRAVKIILDTNVFISGIFWSGPPYQILKAWQQRKFESHCVSINSQ